MDDQTEQCWAGLPALWTQSPVNHCRFTVCTLYLYMCCHHNVTSLKSSLQLLLPPPMHCIYTYMCTYTHTHSHAHIHVCTYTLTGLEAESSALEDLYDYVYSNFMEEIDAVDNGISDRDGEPRYVFMCGSSLLPLPHASI